MKSIILIFVLLSGLICAEDSKDQSLIIFYTNDLHGGITEQEADFLNPDFPPILGGGAAAANIIFQGTSASSTHYSFFLEEFFNISFILLNNVG